MSDERVGDIVDLANAQKPDLTVLLGDYVCTHRLVSGYVPPGARASSWPASRRRLASYAILGNHDWWWAAIPTEPADNSRSVCRALAEVGVPLLENQSVRLSQRGRPFWLIGLGDLLAPVPNPRRGRGADDLPAAMREVYDDAPAILLVHEPYFFPWVPDRIALTLAGHMHGGQVNVPIIGPPVGLLKRRSSKYIRVGREADDCFRRTGNVARSGAHPPPAGSGDGEAWRGRRARLIPIRTGAIEATSNAAIVQLNGRVTRGSLSKRLSEAPNSNQTPLHGIAIKAQSAAMKRTLLI